MRCALVVNEFKDYSGTMRAYKLFFACKQLTDLIIVDNASNDGTYERLVPLAGNNVHVLGVQGINQGFSKGFNVGFRYATSINCDIIFQCCSDIIFNEELIKKCIDFINEKENCGAVSGRQLTPNGEERNSAWMFPNFWDDVKWCYGLWRRFRAPGYYASKKLNTNEAFVITDTLSGAFTCYRASALEKAGYLDEAVFLYNEENIIGCRIRRNGFFLARLNDVFYIHDHIEKEKRSILSPREVFKKIKSGYYLHKEYNSVNKAKLLLYYISLLWYSAEVFFVSVIRNIWRALRDE